MVNTRSKTTAGSNTNSRAAARTTRASPTQTATTRAGVRSQSRPYKAQYPRKKENRKYREFPPGGDFAAELRRSRKVQKAQRCDRCSLMDRQCSADIDGCIGCKGVGARCTVTDFRTNTTWVKGDPLPSHIQMQNQLLENQIKNLTNQVAELKSHLKYDTEAQALSDLRQENERLRAENDQYRSMSMSTTAGNAAAFQTEENRLTRPSPMLPDAPFATQQLDIGGNPYTPATRADNTDNRAGATTNPVTLPTWAQPAPAGYVADPGYIPGMMNTFSGPAADPIQESQGYPGRDFPGLAVDPTLLTDPTASVEGQEYFTQPFLDYVYGDEQVNDQANVNDPNNYGIGDVVDDDTLFDEIMWDQ
ncbi:hypothetical protein BJX62DRAFT_104882 [Aspergillus germanicus]